MEYKTIEIPITEISDKERDYIFDINNSFSNEDIKIDFQNNEILIHLKQLDFELFKNKINLSDGDFEYIPIILNRIESIKSYGLNGKKRLYVGYNDERKVKDRELKEEKRENYYYANNNNFSKKNNDLTDEFINKILCGDSENILKNIPDNSIDIVFTSPPYNFGLDYNNNEDDHHWELYFKKLFIIFNECIRVLKYGGRIIVNTQPLFSDYIPSHHIISNFFMGKK